MPSPTQRWGFGLEEEAAKYLAGLGFRIVHRNFRGGGGEIDLIAWEGEVLSFIEVRARSTDRFGDPSQTVGVAKQRRIVGAAMAYLRRLPHWPMARFDVVSIVAARDDAARFSLIRNAFDAGW